MKKSFLLSAFVALFAMVTMSFTVKGDEQSNSQPMVLKVSTGANGEIVSVKGDVQGTVEWGIKDLSGYTNIRERPNGRVCMRLKAWTEYVITTYSSSGSWLQIAHVFNLTEDYGVRLHSSKTGKYYIAKSILYRW